MGTLEIRLRFLADGTDADVVSAATDVLADIARLREAIRPMQPNTFDQHWNYGSAILKARTVALGFCAGQRVVVGCGFEGSNRRSGTILEISECGLAQVKFDDGGIGGRNVSSEWMTQIVQPAQIDG
jgi:hypothetical protein